MQGGSLQRVTSEVCCKFHLYLLVCRLTNHMYNTSLSQICAKMSRDLSDIVEKPMKGLDRS